MEIVVQQMMTAVPVISLISVIAGTAYALNKGGETWEKWFRGGCFLTMAYIMFGLPILTVAAYSLVIMMHGS